MPIESQVVRPFVNFRMHRISESMHTGCGDTASSQICSNRADFAAKVQKTLVAAKALVGAAGDLTLIENALRDADEALAAELRKSEHRHLQLLWYWMGCVLDIRQMLLRQSV